MRNKKKVLFLGLLLVFALASAFAVMRPQKTNSEKTLPEKQFAKLDAELPIVDFDTTEPSDTKERAKREAKSKRFNRFRENIGPETTSSAYVYHWPEAFNAIPADLSDVILIGKVRKAQAILTKDKSSVYSEFSIEPENILKGSGITLGKLVVAEREGGRVRFPNGFISRYSVAGFGMPQVDARYVVFLKKMDDTSDYSILTAYQLRDGQILPLDSSPGVVNFEKYSGMDESSFLAAVRAAIEKNRVSASRKRLQ